MEITETKIITEPRKISCVVGVKCDRCGDIIQKGKVYYHITTHHNDWGNDSIDSYENFDLCSDCYLPFTENYFERATGTEEIDISREINILE